MTVRLGLCQRFVDAGAVNIMGGYGVGAVSVYLQDDVCAVVVIAAGCGGAVLGDTFADTSAESIVLEADGADGLSVEY